jgi:hypothetical protein
LPADVFTMSCFDGIYPIPIGSRMKEVKHFTGSVSEKPAAKISPSPKQAKPALV